MWFGLLWFYCFINIWSLVCIVFNFASNNILPHEWEYIKKYNLFGKVVFTFPFWLSIIIFYMIVICLVLIFGLYELVFIKK